MLGFITKVTAVRVAATTNPSAARPLREQAFASAEKLSEVVAKVNAALAGPVPEAAAKACLYLTNPATRAILFRPIKSNIAEAHGQVAQLLEAEYLPEEAAAVPLMQPDALGAALEF
ncbi:component of oligomeric golgi complex 3 [Monoraphidium neglectum]|uniref:Component of oligomeric golgi complex 3 n=1 Tax=Monoraphidium neglectum TaxID=145388 RepID=A0A0D2IWL9_9CHLO|nr:component of oligomeric golgi complex 3 [Monoraphidium neglectum]KIY92377.1 component of oligomeric golgi complex 3 [Monoraphidium neglectum]|eukprot:XP_013891397.1 component of oligomeric golgi complex 3 [Monoraphidium neglectum]